MKKFYQFFCLIFLSANLAAGNFYSWDFDSCELKDILFMISTDTGISISADDTVTGRGSLKFSGSDFNVAFESFLEENRLFVTKTDSRWVVSRFYLTITDHKYSLDVCDLLPVQIMEKLSLNLNEVINYEQLPAVKLSMHFRNVSKQDLLEGIAARFGNYEIDFLDNKISLHKSVISPKVSADESYVKITTDEEKKFCVDVKNCTFFEVLEKLFSVENGKKDYCLLTQSDSKIIRSSFSENSFENTVKEICGQTGYEYILKKSIYYFIKSEDSQQTLLYGDSVCKEYKTEYLSFSKVKQLLSKRFKNLDVVELPDEKAFYCTTTELIHNQIKDFIVAVDVPEKSYTLQLKYIDNEAFVAGLPPEFDRNRFHISSNNGPVYFSGSFAEYENLQNRIKEFDKPPVCIRYDLLILQYDESVHNSWSSSFNANRISLGDRNNLGVQIGSLMNLNLNLVTSFGLTFAAKVQSAIEENSTKVFADTVLYGVSGKPINFQNTSTYRYRDNNLDPETGKPIYSGITREISSGIKLDVCGWVSGDGVVTSMVTASVSRQGIDTSASTGNPPPTTEKLVTTEVCGRSGEPIVLSGLLQNSTSASEVRTPLISKLPLLGNLFKSKSKTKEKEQMVIFLVPHVDYEVAIKSDFLSADWANRRISKLKNLEAIYE